MDKIQLNFQPDRTSPLPLYAQFKQWLIELIVSDQLSPGFKLPSEVELAEICNLSLATVRQEMTELSQEERIPKIHGKGTFISERKVDLSIAHKLLGFSDDMTQKGHNVTTKVLEVQVYPPPKEVAEALGVSIKSPTCLLKRLRSLDGQPFMLDTIYLRLDLFPGIEKVDFQLNSLFHIFETQYHISIARAKRNLRVVSAEPWAAKLLGIKKGEPLHLLTDLVFNDINQSIMFAHTLVHGARSEFQFDLVLERNATNNHTSLANPVNPTLRLNVQ